MKFFKYLVFIIITICSSSAFALSGYRSGNGDCAQTKEAACASAFANRPLSLKNAYRYEVIGDYCNLYEKRFSSSGAYIGDASVSSSSFAVCDVVTKCPRSGYPVPTYFDANTPIPLRVCKQNPDGTFCVYDAANKADPLVISLNEKQQIVLQSVSEIPSPSCTPEFSKNSCDPKDPYGGCYQPPDDGCNRLSDGSIYCPEGTPPPPIQSGCKNGASYCAMPPTGCGPNYVPGNFNGQQICVKNSNPPPTDPIDQPPSSSPPPINPPDPNDPPPSSTPPPAIPPDNGPILRAILDAINAVNNKLTWLKNELVNSLNYIAKKIDTTNAKLDTTNQKLDAVNDSVKATTVAVNTNGQIIKAAVDANANTVKTALDANTSAVKGAVDANTNSTANKLNEVVNAINNKPVGGGGGGTTDVKPVVDAIEKQTTDFKDMMKTDSSDFDTSQYEKIGDASDDPRSLNAQSDAAGSLQALSNKLTFSNSACVQDFTVTVPIYGSMTVPLSQWCDLLALVKILLHLCTLMVAFKMLDSTVRAI
ncbi:hypothetical protein ACQR8D_27325 [Klebsiella pneumoniae]|uniref:hypothetical protein n=1 Tax=Acinetobacter baumannii TaxID=470 RepID=UPI0002BA4AF7|nr:hypothetical protein [Acinetobacter baumannii]